MRSILQTGSLSMAKFKIFLKNTLLLTFTSLIMRTVGVYYNLYLTDRLGADGMGLFTLTGSVYGLAVTLATSAVTLASTRLVSEAMGESVDGKERESGRILAAMKVCIKHKDIISCSELFESSTVSITSCTFNYICHNYTSYGFV